MSLTFDSDVRAALEARRGDWKRIAEQCDVSHSWISQFVRRKIPNPGYDTLRRIYAALTQQPDGAAATGERCPEASQA